MHASDPEQLRKERKRTLQKQTYSGDITTDIEPEPDTEGRHAAGKGFTSVFEVQFIIMWFILYSSTSFLCGLYLILVRHFIHHLTFPATEGAGAHAPTCCASQSAFSESTIHA